MHRSDASGGRTIRARPGDVNLVWHRFVMRWLRRGLVALLLAAPIVVVVVVAWPSDEGAGAGLREGGSGPEGALVAGDTVQGQLAPGEVAEFRLVGDGEVRVDATGLQDGTLTVRDGDGREVAFDDDTNGLDPQLTVDPAGDELTVELRDLAGFPGAFTLSVD